MKKLIQLFVWLVCSFTVIIAGAKHHKSPRPTPVVNQEVTKGPGILVTGPAFKLPQGIVLAKKAIPGYDFGTNCELGAGGLVSVRLGLRNKTSQPVTVILPAGLTFISLDEKTQNGILIKEEAIVVPAGSTTSHNLALFCLNEERDITKAKDKYKLGPVSDDQDLKVIMELLQDKDLKDEHDHAMAQKVIWDVTKGFALTAAQHRNIASIPRI
ncbi:hypothetical protein GFS24_06775 [Chitinophaga sp. SYP-B3965]|uniref:hypothetical protein n=1 Tax=Chitinophaga sp. SYP-B3965 TaxID=2663120 RepID=UPI0012995236|nr:hypothetical protein [Chitinophaga sp. SYP-B3965]MRG44810.1 hypothetical protein [Chitinophaga sp. SYP-B3965]